MTQNGRIIDYIEQSAGTLSMHESFKLTPSKCLDLCSLIRNDCMLFCRTSNSRDRGPFMEGVPVFM